MPLGIEARSHAGQRRFGRQRQSGGPVPPHPSPLPKGAGASLAALRARGCARYARVGLGLTLSATERVLCRSSRELSGGLDLSPRGTKRRPAGAPACSRLSYGVRPQMGPASNRNSHSGSAVQPDAGETVESRSLASPQGTAAHRWVAGCRKRGSGQVSVNRGRAAYAGRPRRPGWTVKAISHITNVLTDGEPLLGKTKRRLKAREYRVV